MIIIASAIIVTIVVAIASYALIIIKDRTYFHSPPYEAATDVPSDVLVVYYSRSGNTEAMAREIARKYEADIIRIEAKDYTLDYKGWRKAGKDADLHAPAEITPETVDMSQYQLVFLGSPIWWFRPAPPLWTFVEKNDFKDKDIVLFNTFNSRFKSEDILEFQQKVEQRGGHFIDHVYIKRGRVYRQISGEELILRAQDLLNNNMEKWADEINRK